MTKKERLSYLEDRNRSLEDYVQELESDRRELKKDIESFKTRMFSAEDNLQQNMQRENNKLWYLMRVAMRDETLDGTYEDQPYSHPFKT